MNKKIIIGISIALGVLMFTSVFASLYYFDAGEFLRLSRANTEGGAQSMLATPSQFQVNGCGDGTVLDRVTNICWQRDWGNISGVNWNDAKDACSNLELGGHKDWSLPTVKEYRRFIAETQISGSHTFLETLGFENVQSNWYWTQTPRGSSAWVVGLLDGSDGWLGQGGTSRAVCSRWNN